MQYHILFSGKNKKNISKCHLLTILPRVQSIKAMLVFITDHLRQWFLHCLVFAFWQLAAGLFFSCLSLHEEPTTYVFVEKKENIFG